MEWFLRGDYLCKGLYKQILNKILEVRLYNQSIIKKDMILWVC
ncbi:hypothetical protein BTURTLESOX_2096 [bacterium endosymbiont of Bathymodiolus sp. 5 South]|nr:hypothetical protein [uncultured Gammaproteobacteria bacterium]SHN92528.1 hypothetical protein BCLUESOX_2604 [bacterium endosymbiont of Bathymodiolus sp. 5 South]CAC9657982.1 hypothetical protein [uncultured Gammaproteobacteria bacterium]CAC9660247.1 hypothetical protein [uncultured Gammaproteobacteria bacterium]SSC08163.1 hypothetical protein BTURTLESOX_2096 [bacterium endosymbiont of Bathymodiolus sp. 5 South]